MDIQNHPFLENLAPAELDGLLRSSELVSFAPGEVIFEEGSFSEDFYLILDGAVEFSKRMEGDQTLYISHSDAGGCIGELGVFTGQPRALRAQARGQARLLRLPGDVLMNFLSNLPGPASHIISNLVRHLHNTTAKSVGSIVNMQKLSVIGEMTSRIIHDFRNPFTLIGLGCEMILEKHRDADTAELCGLILTQVQRMGKMAEEVQDFTRGTSSLELRVIDVESFFAQFRRLYLTFFNIPEVEIWIECESMTVRADESKLMRVFQNLVGNAIEAFAGGPGRIEIHARRAGGLAVFTVADNGPGIPEDIRGTLFEPFVTKGKKSGMGLGTSIVKSQVEAHGGSIRFQTETGKGTLFTVTLPA